MDVVYFNVAHFLEGHVWLFKNLAVAVFLCNFAYSLNVLFLGLFCVALFIFDVLDFGYFFSGKRSFADKVQVLEVGMVEKSRADCWLELLFALDFLVNRDELL